MGKVIILTIIALRGYSSGKTHHYFFSIYIAMVQGYKINAGIQSLLNLILNLRNANEGSWIYGQFCLARISFNYY